MIIFIRELPKHKKLLFRKYNLKFGVNSVSKCTTKTENFIDISFDRQKNVFFNDDDPSPINMLPLPSEAYKCAPGANPT